MLATGLHLLGMTSTVTSAINGTQLLGIALGAICTVALIGFLVAKELVGAAGGNSSVRWSRVLNIGIAPLLVAFAVVVVTNVAHLI